MGRCMACTSGFLIPDDRYTPALQAVLLAYSNIKFADTTANILFDCPFAITDVSFNAVVWSPKIGHRLGTYNRHDFRCSPANLFSTHSGNSLPLIRITHITHPVQDIQRLDPARKYSTGGIRIRRGSPCVRDPGGGWAGAG
jgi:hypothetical protein